MLHGCAMSAGQCRVRCEFRVNVSLLCLPWSQPLCNASDVLVLHGCWGGNTIRHVNVTLEPSGRAPAWGGRVRKRPWRNERKLVAGLYLSAVLFPGLSNLSPGCKFYVLFCDRVNRTRWLCLGADYGASLSSSALPSKEWMIDKYSA